MKNSDNFHISAQNIDCGYSLEPPHRGGSNEYPQSMFLSRNKNNNVYPCKPQFYYIQVGFKGVKIIQACFRDVFEDMPLVTFSHCAACCSSLLRLVPLLQFFLCVRPCFYIWRLCRPYLFLISSSFWCLGTVVLRNRGIFWASSFICLCVFKATFYIFRAHLSYAQDEL